MALAMLLVVQGGKESYNNFLSPEITTLTVKAKESSLPSVNAGSTVS